MYCISTDPACASLSLGAHVFDDSHYDSNMLNAPSCMIQRSDVCAPESQYSLCFDDSYVQLDSHSVQQVASKSEASVSDYARVNNQDLPQAFECSVMLVDEPGNDSDTGINFEVEDLTSYSSKRMEWSEWDSQLEVWGKNSPDIGRFNVSDFEFDSNDDWDRGVD
jgi:hypothetical protein